MNKRRMFAGILTFFLVLGTVFPMLGISVQAQSDTTIKVGSFNIAATRNGTIEEMSELMEGHGLEIAGIQEVDRFTSRNPIDMLEEFTNQGYFTQSHFTKTIDFGGGEYGIGILSTEELTDKGGGPLTSEGISEARAYSRALIEKDGKEIAFYCTHLTHENMEVRQRQLAEVLEVMDQDPTPYKIMVGDFNTGSSVKENYPMMMNYNTVNGYDGKWLDSYSGSGDGNESDSKAIDNIIISRNIEIVSSDVDQTRLSDHYLLYAELRLLDEEVPSAQLLNLLLADADELKESGLSEAASLLLEQAVAKAENVDLTSQAAINEACTNLTEVMDNLDKVNAVWTMDEGQGQIITDMSGAYTGTLHGGVSWTEGRYGSGLSFDGTGYVDTGIKEDLDGDWTISMWVNRAEHNGSNTILLSGDMGELKLEQWNNTGKVGITQFGVADYTFDYSAPIGEWVHLAFTADSNGTTLYVNGEEADHLNVFIDGPVSGIGANSEDAAAGNEGGYLVGKVDELKIYNRACSAEEISGMMDETEIPEEPEEPSEVSTAVLEGTVKLAQAADTQGVVPIIVKEFEKRLAEAEEILERVKEGDKSITQDMVDDCWKSLISIIQYLEFKQGDKTDLEKAIDFAESLDMNEYEDNDKKAEFLEALEVAKAVRDDENALQDEVTDAWKALIKATSELNRKRADMTDLNKVIAWAGSLDLNLYLEEGQQEFNAALDAARNVAGNIMSSQKEVDDAWKALMDAASALRLKPDKDLLEELLGETEHYLTEEASYDQAAFASFKAVYAQAEAVYMNDQASEEDVKAAVERLTSAAASLKNNMDITASAEEAEKGQTIVKVDSKQTAGTTEEVKTAKAVKTGDAVNPMYLAVLLGASACIAAAAAVKKASGRR